MRKTVSANRPAAVIVYLCLIYACGQPGPRVLDLATTTSVQNAGLLAQLVPMFERSTGTTVRVHATGSGRALRMLEQGAVAAVISHAPDTEQRLMGRHPEWSYRKLAYNWFVIVGPAADPAQVRGVADVVQAFQRIVDSRAVFVSRGDESGTHERENALWAAAGRRPAGDRLLVSGRGMAQALRHADEAQGYTLTDAPTFWQVGRALGLQILFEKDDRLLNAYAVIHRPDHVEGVVFADWLFSAAGRAQLGSFRIEGKPGFTLWPDGCAASKPTDLPCR